MDLDFGKVKWTDAEMKEKIEELGGGGGGFDVLWENQDVAATMNSSITLTSSLEGYRFYEIIYALSCSESSYFGSSGKLVSKKAVRLQEFAPTTGIYIREIVVDNPQVLTVRSCYRYTSLTGASVSGGNNMVPYMILGYK